MPAAIWIGLQPSMVSACQLATQSLHHVTSLMETKQLKIIPTVYQETFTDKGGIQKRVLLLQHFQSAHIINTSMVTFAKQKITCFE